MMLRCFWYNFILKHVSFTKLKSNWLLVSTNNGNNGEKNDIKVDRLTRVARLVIKNSTMRSWYL